MTSLTVEQITYRVRKIIADHCGLEPESVGLGETMDYWCFDSLDHVEISMFVEEELRIHTPDDLIGHKTTAGQIIEFAAKQLGVMEGDSLAARAARGETVL